MNDNDVLELLAAHRDERGIEKWKELGLDASGLSSLGIGLTQLRTLAKQVGRNRDLALTLWQTDVYEARVISLLIDDPKAITREQAEAQVEQVDVGMLSHVFSTCGSSLSRTPFVVDLVDRWTASADRRRRYCGYGLLYEVARLNGKKAPDDGYFLEHVERIGKAVRAEDSHMQLAMASALMSIGKRNTLLNAAALRVARKVGPIDFESPSGRCEPFDVVKHLTTDRLKQKLGM
jgi:3-methyladenine DNA glycosylase AlkD